MKTLSRREFFAGASRAGIALLGAHCLGSDAMAALPEKPNFVFILIDDMGWRDAGCFGSTFYLTPNIDRLARQGVRFRQAYAAAPVCSPTRASILTGKYPARLGITDYIHTGKSISGRVLPAGFELQLPLEETTIAEALKPAGYVSAAIGKWHLGGPEYWPEKQGFRLNIGGTGQGHPPSYFSPYKISNIPSGPEGEYLTDRLTDEAEKFIEQNKDRPFFLYLSHYAVHTPLQAKKEIIAKYEGRAQPGQWQNNATYAAMIQSTDESVGRVMAKLRETGIEERTVVVFMSDNGGLEKATSNRPLRGGKGSLFEGGIREPMIIRWPGVTKPGSVCDVPVTSVDFFPTILEAAGVRLPSPRPSPVARMHGRGSAGGPPEQVHGRGSLDGISLVPLLKRGEKPARGAIYWHYPHYSPQGYPPMGAIRQGDYKLIEFFEDNHAELYNLTTDVGETKDLSAELPEKTAELQKKLSDWRKSVGARMPSPNPDWRKSSVP